MRRIASPPRLGWEARVESAGLLYHTPGGRPYWDDTACYEFSPADIDVLEAAAAELHRRCIDAAQHVIDHDRLGEFGIAPPVAEAIRLSWQGEPPSLYGRFDLAYDGSGPPKLLEYNADTPTSLLEAAVVQWDWLQDVAPDADQWNSIHERLVAAWRAVKPHLPPLVHFAYVDESSHEDVMTVTYLRDTAAEAGIDTIGVPMESIGLEELDPGFEFVDATGIRIRALFKLYPWEWVVHEQGGAPALEALAGGMVWMEPIWKMLWSNKAILPVLWQLFPQHPNLLPATFKEPAVASYVRKPKLSREGANVTIVHDGVEVERTGGDYGEEGFIYQALAPMRPHDGRYPVIGAWMIDGEPAGMGIRESEALITGNLARFVPHVIR
jgi:glutathionylspermidine synthase